MMMAAAAKSKRSQFIIQTYDIPSGQPNDIYETRISMVECLFLDLANLPAVPDLNGLAAVAKVHALAAAVVIQGVQS